MSLQEQLEILEKGVDKIIASASDARNENLRLHAIAMDYFVAVAYWLEQVYDGEPLKDWQVKLIAAHRKAKGQL